MTPCRRRRRPMCRTPWFRRQPFTRRYRARTRRNDRCGQRRSRRTRASDSRHADRRWFSISSNRSPDPTPLQLRCLRCSTDSDSVTPDRAPRGIALSNDKCAAKSYLSRLSLPTPEWITADSAPARFRADHYIVKARFEHASQRPGRRRNRPLRFTRRRASRRARTIASNAPAVFCRTIHPRPRIQSVAC